MTLVSALWFDFIDLYKCLWLSLAAIWKNMVNKYASATDKRFLKHHDAALRRTSDHG